jgi:hemerythrin
MFNFTYDCILGVEQIDDEHRHLFDLMNKIMYMLRDGYYMPDRYADIKAILVELEEYADEHFRHEEEYMEKIRDPEIYRQRAQHMVFHDKVRDWSFLQIDDIEEQRAALEDMMQFLAQWLYHHILSSDIMIGKLPSLEEWQMKENPCEFTEEYFTGNDLIDGEHQELFRIIDKANRMVQEGDIESRVDEIINIIDELFVYTKYHFKDEEEYMESICYEGLDAQKRAHQAFISKLEEIDKETVETNPNKYMQGMMSFLMGWLINHILNMDKKIPVN